MSDSIHHQIVIIGGGTAGISVAARLTKGWFNQRDVAVIEPSETHFYQPFWTLVGGGIVPKEASSRPEASVIPRRVTWIRDAVTELIPEQNLLRTRDGKTITYDWLVVAAGLQINWEKIPGLKESVGHAGVCSNYSYNTVGSTWEATGGGPKPDRCHPGGTPHGSVRRLHVLPARDRLRKTCSRGIRLRQETPGNISHRPVPRTLEHVGPQTLPAAILLLARYAEGTPVS